MSENPEVHAVSDQVMANEQPVSIWSSLRQAREARNWAVAEVSARIKLTSKQIEAIEAGDLDKLPSLTFARGFIRNYAKVLDLDVAPFMQALMPVSEVGAMSGSAESSALHSSSRSKSVEVSSSRSAGKSSGKVVFLAFILIVVAAVWWGLLPKTKTLPTAVAPVQTQEETVPLPVQSSEPVSSPEPVASVPPVAAEQSAPVPVVQEALLQFKFSADSWVGVKDKTGKALFQHMNTAGTSHTLKDAQEPLSLTVGNAKSVEVLYKGQKINIIPYITSGGVARFSLPLPPKK